MARRSEAIVSARLPTEIADVLREAARASDRSISGQLRFALRQWVAQQSAAAK